MSQVSEGQVQANVLEFLRTYDVDAVAIDAGGRRARGRMIAAAKAAGVPIAANIKLGAEIPAGFADLEATLAPSGRSLYIEVKAPMWIDDRRRMIRFEGKASSGQLDFLREKARRGALVMVAWSSVDVEEYLRGELDVNWKSLR